MEEIYDGAVLMADSDIHIYADVYSDSGSWLYNAQGEFVSINGDYNRYKWPTLPQGQHYSNVYYVLHEYQLPRPGSYGLKASFYQANIGFSPTSASVLVTSAADNVTPEAKATLVDFVRDGVRFGISGNVVIDYSTSNITVALLFPEHLRDLDILVPFNGAFQFTYSKQPGDTATGVTDPNNSGSADDIVADNTGQLVDEQKETNGLLMSIIQTISNQLSAFWDQLAGVFTDLFTKMNEQHQEDLDAMQGQTDELVSNQDENTNIITSALDRLGNFLIEGLKSLFIPSDEFFKAWFDDMYQFFEDRLGFLMLPIELLKDLVEVYLNAGTAPPGIPFPEFKWVDGTVIIPAQTVGFTFLEADWGKEIQDNLYFVGNVIMIGALLALMHRKIEGVLRG